METYGFCFVFKSKAVLVKLQYLYNKNKFVKIVCTN